MSAFECWESQREPLRRALDEQASMADVVYSVRHALLQTEQNAMSELKDDELRQQAGVLFSCVKTSIGLLEARVTPQVWLRQEQDKPSHGARSLWAVAALLQALLGLVCYTKGMWLGFGLSIGALGVAVAALLAGRKKPKKPAEQAETRVTLKPDADKLLMLLDAQFRAIDRYINDFAYLNERLRGGGDGADAQTLSRFADLMEALYECDPAEREPAEEAAKQLMEGMKLRALDYSEESRRLFTALPSKSETRTLSPAIVSTADSRLLRRGTAAVKTEVA